MYVVLGAGRFGYELVRGLDCERKEILVIDEDPNILSVLEKQGFDVMQIGEFSPKQIK